MNDLRERTKKFAIDVLLFCGKLPQRADITQVSRQLIKCGTSVGANYRSAKRSKSARDFVAKLSIVEEEADESAYWLEILEAIYPPDAESRRLKDEASQLTAIMVSSKKTARRNIWKE
jgi:four helix bundle protein